ncbi:MAG: ABC transporter substrate-binding protein [Thermodesulfobacteriota bacterium]
MKGKLVFFMVLMMTVTLGFAPGPAGAEEVLKIGALFPFSGSIATWGLASFRGVDLMADKINREGGIKVGGKVYKIELIKADDKSDFNVALAQANKFIFNDKIRYIMGPVMSGATLAILPVSEPEKVIVCSTSYSPKVLGPDKKYSFRLMGAGNERTDAIYLFLKAHRPDLKTVGSIGPNDETGWGTAEYIHKKAVDLGLTSAFKDFYQRGTNDFYPLLTKMMQKPPDVLIPHSVPPGEFALLMKQKHELGYKGLIITPSHAEPPMLVEKSGAEAVEGLIFQTPEFTGPRALPGHRELHDAYLAKYKETFNTTSAATYTYLLVIKAAMEKANSLDTTKVAETISTLEIPGPFGPIKFGGEKTYGMKHQIVESIFLSEIKKGVISPLATVTPPVP